MTEKLDFRISSGLKNIIGKELITNDLIAIFELVKNSYDANAKNVGIIFQDIKDGNKGNVPKILIIDDGDGMSYDDLIGKWLFVGYSDKKSSDEELETSDFRDKIDKKRIVAGAKGVGRFSCDRLGSELNLFTKRENEEFIHHLYMDWSKFEKDQTKEFQTIDVEYSTVESMDMDVYHIKNFRKGTILEITSLNNSWNGGILKKLKKYLQRLINPSQVDEKLEFKISLEAKEYEEDDEKNQHKGDLEVINGTIKNIIFEKMGIKTTQINCYVNDKGNKIYTELIDKGNFIFSLEEKNEFTFLKNIRVKLFFLNPIAKANFKRVMGSELWVSILFNMVQFFYIKTASEYTLMGMKVMIG